MPSRSFFDVPDQLANKFLLEQYHSEEIGLQIDKFVAKGIAPLVDVHSIGRLVGVGGNIIHSLSKKTNAHYRTFSIPKKSGGYRQISSPRTYLKVVQWWILDNILKSQKFDECVTAFVSGCSPMRNAQRHVGSSHLLCIDLTNFFPSISKERVIEIWRSLGYGEAVSEQLGALCTLEGKLPQGAPTSPLLANLAAAELDKKLKIVSSSVGYNYTRYADDITFSSQHPIPVEFVKSVSDVVSACGFEVNKKKTRFVGKGGAMEVTGYIINSYPQLPRTWRKNARSAFYSALRNPYLYVDRINYLRGLFGAVSSFADEGDELRSNGKSAIEAVLLCKSKIK